MQRRMKRLPELCETNGQGGEEFVHRKREGGSIATFLSFYLEEYRQSDVTKGTHKWMLVKYT